MMVVVIANGVRSLAFSINQKVGTMKRILTGTVASGLLGMIVACSGSAGSDGTDGTDGTNGSNGTNGAPGPTGPAGATGATGATGPAGPAGADGVLPTAVISVVAEPNNAGVNAGAFPNYTNIVQTGSGATAGLGTFNKVNATTTILATYQGHVSTTPTLAAGVECLFQLRVDGVAGTGVGLSPGLTAFGPQPNSAIPGSFTTAFGGLAAGTHTLQLFASCQPGTATIAITPNGGGFNENAQIVEL